MAPSHGFAAASHREAALRGAPTSDGETAFHKTLLIVASGIARLDNRKVKDVLGGKGRMLCPVYSSDHPRRVVLETVVNWLRQTA